MTFGPSSDRPGMALNGDVPILRLASPDLGTEELAAVERVLGSGILTHGPEAEALEGEFAGRHCVKHAVALANGTLALTAIMLGLEVGPGDEVIVPSFTFISSATSVLHVGATPVFVDVRKDTYNLDPHDLSRCISPRTRAVMAVHYAGQPAAMDEIREALDDESIVLIEDAAQAHGAGYKGVPVGGSGRAAMFSFTPTKNITMGEGAIVTTNDEALATRLRLFRNHGQTEVYRHSVLGFNWRLTEMQAAIGRVQLQKLDEIVERKRVNAAWMNRRLAGVERLYTPFTSEDSGHVWMLYTIVLHPNVSRDRVRDRLIEEGIEARVYFPPAHRQPIFNSVPLVDLPITDHLGRHALSLPFHARLARSDLERIADTLERVLSEE